MDDLQTINVNLDICNHDCVIFMMSIEGARAVSARNIVSRKSVSVYQLLAKADKKKRKVSTLKNLNWSIPSKDLRQFNVNGLM